MSSFSVIVHVNVFCPASHKFNFNGCNSSSVFCFNRPGKVSKFPVEWSTIPYRVRVRTMRAGTRSETILLVLRGVTRAGLSTYSNNAQRDEACQSAAWLCAEEIVWQR
jgi:hypothetical protein